MPQVTSRGFTLIELLVVIAIVGVLSSVVLVSLNAARQKAALAKLQSDMQNIQLQVDLVRTRNLQGVTGNNCSDCVGGGGVGNYTDSATSWALIGFSSPPRDPWGMIYRLDENEGEAYGGGGACRYDLVYSSGPDKVAAAQVASGAASGVTPHRVFLTGQGDDYAFALTFYSCAAPN